MRRKEDFVESYEAGVGVAPPVRELTKPTAPLRAAQDSAYRYDPGSRVSHKGVVRAYRRYAPIYDWIFGAILQPGRRALTAAVRELNPSSVLEIGVGTGLTLSGYPQGCSLFGIDLCEEMLAVARRRARLLARPAVELAAMDAEAMSFPDASFDCVTVPYVLSVTPNPQRLVAEIRRVCRKGGTIIIVNHFNGSPFWRVFEGAGRRFAERIGFRSDFAFEEHILGHDWQLTSVQTVNLFGLSRLLVIRNL
jgi:phosphatidylethanolamine/phosphatidyl-N-methylethanolamine N-methyltransferase